MKTVGDEARGSGESRPLALVWWPVLSFGILAALAAPLTLLPGLKWGLPGNVFAAGDPIPEPVLYLTLTTGNGEVLVDAPLPADHTWSLEWTHSVAQVLIVDVFAWRDGTLYVTDQYTPFLDIAGLGNFAGRGDLSELPGGGYHLANIDLPLHGNAHDLIIGSTRAPSVLVVGESRFELSKTHPATHARIEVDLR